MHKTNYRLRISKVSYVWFQGDVVVNCVVLSSDRKYVVSCTDNNIVCVWKKGSMWTILYSETLMSWPVCWTMTLIVSQTAYQVKMKTDQKWKQGKIQEFCGFNYEVDLFWRSYNGRLWKTVKKCLLHALEIRSVAVMKFKKPC